jgi:hypothetical protein
MRPTVLLLVLSATAAMADEVVLKTGGRVTGVVQRLDDGGYHVTTAAGTAVRLDRSQVDKLVESSAEQNSYAERAHAAPDTVEAQLALANWCREHHLSDEASRHAERVVELDPTNATARQMLNFRQVDGEWMTREQLMQSRGMVWFEGKYRTRQEIAIRERGEKLKQAEVHWKHEIKQWRRWLDDRQPERVQQAVANFDEVRDPLAGPPIVDLLQDERDPAVRRLLAKTASQIEHQATVNSLVVLSLNDPDEDLRLSCLEWLIDAHRPGLADAYVKALRSNDNTVINRAATALASLGDESAIGPLIDALITEHKKVVGGNSGGGDTYSLNTQNGVSSFGGGGPKVIEGKLRNPDVLTALVRLTNEHFGYDQALWKKWHATQARLVQVDLRRDK